MAHLAIAHKSHDEIEKEVKATCDLDPAERITKWATALSEKCNVLSPLGVKQL